MTETSQYTGLRFFRESAERVFAIIRPMIVDANERLPSIGTYIGEADETGKLSDIKKIGHFKSDDGARAEVVNCRRKIALLAERPNLMSSAQGEDPAADEGAVRSEDGRHIVCSTGLPPGGWNEALITVTLHWCNPKLMSRERIRKIQKLSGNLWICPLMRACKLKY